jgi:hypothetical protein
MVTKTSGSATKFISSRFEQPEIYGDLKAKTDLAAV